VSESIEKQLEMARARGRLEGMNDMHEGVNRMTNFVPALKAMRNMVREASDVVARLEKERTAKEYSAFVRS
jgi:hypothetical protein